MDKYNKSVILRAGFKQRSWFVPVCNKFNMIIGGNNEGMKSLIRLIETRPSHSWIRCSLNIVLTSKENLKDAMQNKRSLIVITDISIITSDDFVQLVKSTNNNCNRYLIITNKFVKLSSLMSLGYSKFDLFRMLTINDGKDNIAVMR